MNLRGGNEKGAFHHLKADRIGGDWSLFYAKVTTPSSVRNVADRMSLGRGGWLNGWGGDGCFMTGERVEKLVDRGIGWVSLVYGRIRAGNKDFPPPNTYHL